MKIADIVLIGSIAIVFNFFIHSLASVTFKDLQFNERNTKTITMIIFFGIMALVITQFIIDRHKQYNNSIVSKGFKLGGLLLIFTALFANWNSVQDELKLFLMGAALATIIWYCYRSDVSVPQVSNEQIIDEVLQNETKIENDELFEI